MAIRSAFQIPEILSDFTGVTNPVADAGSETGLCQPGLGAELTAIPLARLRIVGPTPPDGLGRSAKRAPSFRDDYYDRMHVIPSAIKVGNLLEDTIFQIEVFNAHMVPATETSLMGYGIEGLELAGLDPPVLILAMSSALGSLTVRMAGPPTIDGSYVFSFSLGPDVELEITGSRVIAFSLSPNWREPVTETLLWWTEILESRDGSEQRIIMRAWPRWRLTFTVLETGARAGLLDSLLAGWGGRSYVVPLWHQRARLKAPVNAGGMLATCDTEGRGFELGGLCVLWRDGLRCEMSTVAAVAANSVTMSTPAGRGYDWGYLVPAKFCRLVGDECSISAYTSELLEAEVTFEAEEPERLASAPLPVLADGLGLFPYVHDFASPRERFLERSMNEYDSGLASPSRTDRRGYPVDRIEFDDILLGGRDKLAALKGFVQSVNARAGEFWVEINEALLRLSRRVEKGTMMMRVADTAYGVLSSGLFSRRMVSILTRKGRHLNEVTSFSETPDGDLTLTMANAWTVDLEPEEVDRIGFLIKARLDRDELEIEHVADDLARVSLGIRGLPN